MADITALEKHGCPACGGQATWDPGLRILRCRYCGTESPYEIDIEGEVHELDLVATLRDMPEDARGWNAEKKTVQCQSCQAISVFDPGRVGQNCDFCGSASLVDYEEIKSPIRPRSVLPFRLDSGSVRDSMRKWFRHRWFAPARLKTRAFVDTIKGVYLPYWTFDAQVDCPWTAESGTYYYRTQTYRDSKGRTRTRQVRHTRWRNASGRLSHFFDDEAVPGSRGVDLDLLRKVEPFPTSEAVPYDTAYLSGFVVEHYQVVLIDAARHSREQMHRELERLCGAQVPGDTYRGLRISPVYESETFKHLLVPVWMLVYTFGKKSYQVIVNGNTGEIAGRYPKSFWKIAGLVVLAAAVGAVFLWFNR